MPLLVLQAIQNQQVRVHSLMITSLGNLVATALPELCPRLPDVVILNRAFTSTAKVTGALYPPPLNYLLRGVASLSGWNADAEEGFLRFLEKTPEVPREVHLIEARGDTYFAGRGAPREQLHADIARFGPQVSRIQFWPHPLHRRAHHAVALNQLRYNCETRVLAEAPSFSWRPGESAAATIARTVFHRGSEERHTCFCIGGSDATLATGTVSLILPLLKAFIRSRPGVR